MSIALDGNGNSVPEGKPSLSDKNSERLAVVITKAMDLYRLPPPQTFSQLLYVLEAHLNAEEHRRVCKAYEKKADDMVRHLSGFK